LRIATSPDANAPSHLLTSKTSPQYSNPMYFEKGYNTIKSPWRIDPKTRQLIMPKTDVVFDLYADADAPVTNSSYLEATKYTKTGVTYYGKGLILSLKSKDALSGVEKTYVSLNGEAFKEFTKDIEINDAKEYSVKFYAVDNVGNAAATVENKFVVDAQAPTTKMEVTGDFKGVILSPRAKIILTSTDELSGVKQTFYSIDGGKPQVYVSPISVQPLLDGQHSFIFYSIDNVDNNNAGDENVEHSFSTGKDFTNDAVAPSTFIKINGDYFKGTTYEFVSPRSLVEVSATDAIAGVMEIRYGVDQTLNTVYTAPFSLPNAKGAHTVNYNAKDDVQNVAATKSKFYFMDNVAPKTGITFKSPQFFNRDTLFINKETKIKLFAGDYESGVQKTEYSIDGGAFQNYTEEINVLAEGFHTIKFRSTDMVNNIETEKTSTCLVDNNAPDIFVNFSIQATGQNQKDGKNYDVYPSYTQLYVAATDRYSGTEKIYFQINNGAKQLYVSAREIAQKGLLSKEGFYSVKLTAVDKLGNENEKVIEFFISGK
jgi:hypothetical protein